MHLLLLIYCLFILYGSFIPFRFSADPEMLRTELSMVQLYPYQSGVKNFSTADLLSNFILFVPLGALLTGGTLKGLRVESAWSMIWISGAFGFALASVIEAGQLFAPGRTASFLDAVCDALGAAAGAFLSSFWLRCVPPDRFRATAANALRERPQDLLLALTALILMADAFYPFYPTLDISMLRGNLARAQWSPFQGGPDPLAGNISLEKTVLFIILGELARRSVASGNGLWSGRFKAWSLSVFFVAAIEFGKIFFVGRFPKTGTLLLASLAIGGAVVFVPFFTATPIIQRHATEWLLGLLILLIGWQELSPFSQFLVLDRSGHKASHIEWLPLASYYGANVESALFDLAKKILLVAPLGFLLAAQRCAKTLSPSRWAAAAWAVGIGLLFEALQLLQSSRIPSTTDLIIFAVAALLGADLHSRYRRLIAA
ncbi:MAG: VanZ family protein [Deltaproteobacteria bacterium]|nr:VanZ family protein [Deltaproteobacteria bacterium]